MRYPRLHPRVVDSGAALRARRRRGFTLVEVLVALTIGSLLVVAVVSATRALGGARQSVDYRVARSISARRAMGTIVAALRNVRRVPAPDRPVIVGQHATSATGGGRYSRSRLGLGSGSVGQSGGDRIDLQVVSERRVRPDGAESDQYEVSFYLSKLSAERLPVLMCRRDHGLDDHPADGGIATVVAEGIVGLTFEYYSEGQWLAQWSSSEPRAPEAVRVTLEAVGPDHARPPGSIEGRAVPQPVVLSTVVAIHVIDSLGQLPPDGGGPRDSRPVGDSPTGGAQPGGLRP